VEKEGERDHREKCVVMKPKPGAPLKVIEAELLLGLLVHRNPSASDVRGAP
jgi:hypothetical protein